MKQRIVCVVAALAVALILVANGQATTITSGGTHGNNSDVPLDFGSNVTGDATDYVTTDGTGPTPNIALVWAPAPNIWEFHSAVTFSNNGLTVPIIQLDCDDNSGSIPLPPDPTITFIPTASTGVWIHSLELANATDQPSSVPAYGWTITLTRVSDNTVVLTKVTEPLDATPKKITVDFDYVGAIGESYVMRFDDGGVDKWYTGMDNLSFSEVPEPSTLVLLLMGGLAVLGLKRR
ncbi:MAG: PEP-CTERM sorting domain-containing protein [Pirellulales bacterium]|nr:PEP-CTERM sorting domain-containing protein [Pirellulales bacterium]